MDNFKKIMAQLVRAYEDEVSKDLVIVGKLTDDEKAIVRRMAGIHDRGETLNEVVQTMMDELKKLAKTLERTEFRLHDRLVQRFDIPDSVADAEEDLLFVAEDGQVLMRRQMAFKLGLEYREVKA
jgi:hypothetical protein